MPTVLYSSLQRSVTEPAGPQDPLRLAIEAKAASVWPLIDVSIRRSHPGTQGRRRAERRACGSPCRPDRPAASAAPVCGSSCRQSLSVDYDDGWAKYAVAQLEKKTATPSASPLAL